MSGEISFLIKGNAGQLKTELAGASAAVKDFGEQSSKYLQKGEMSAKQLAFATRGIPAQFTDIAVSLQAGQNPLTVFLQQGGQLKDMFGGLGPATKAMGGYIAGLVNPFTIAAAAVAGLGIAMYSINGKDSALLALSTQLAGTGRASVAAIGDIKALVAELNKVSGVSKDSATAILGEFAKVSGLGGAMFRGLGSSAADFAAATGTDLPSAARKLAAAFADPAKGAKDLEASLGTLTAAQILTIEKMAAMGDKSGAQVALMEALKTATQGLAEQAMTPLGQSTEKLSNAWDTMTTAVGKSDAFSSANGWLATLIESAAELMTKLSGVRRNWLIAVPYVGAGFSALELMGDPRQAGSREASGKVTDAFGASQSAVDKQVKAALAATTAYESQAGAMDKLKATAKQARDALKELETQNKGTGIEAVTLRERISGINEKLAEMAKRAAGPKAALSEAAKGLNLYNDLMAVSTGLSANFAEQWAQLSAKFAKDGNMDQLLQGQAALLEKQPYMVDGLKAEAAALAETEKARDKALLAHATELTSLGEKAQKLEDEAALYGLSKSAIEELTTARMLDRIEVLKGFDNSAEEIARIQQTIAARQRLAAAGTALDLKDTNAKAANDMLAAQKKAAEESGKYWEDALMRAFESGKGFFQSLWDTIKNTLKTQVLKVLIQGVGIGGVGAYGTAMAGQGGTSGSLMGIAGAASNLSSAYSMGSTLAVGGQYLAGTMSGLNAVGTIAANATGTGISGLLATNGAYGTAAAGSASGVMGGATAALAAIPVWGWVALAAIAVAGMFGGRGDKKATGGGIEGNFGSSGFNGNSFSTWSQNGGWFHSDRTGKETGGLDAATSKQFTQGYGAVQLAAAKAAVSLGLSADAIVNYSESISLQLGDDAAANEKAIAKLFNDLGDHLASAVAPGLLLLAKEGETSGATLARLSTSITTANAWLSILRQRLFQVSLAGGDAASKLADTFGGLENLTAASKSFYETYYTEGERAARSQQDMTQALASFNLAMPTTKDGLRELAGSLDLNTDSGRAAYAVLLAIAPEFAVAADLASKFAKETADKLIKTFTGGGQLVPALDSAALKTALLGDTLVSTYEVAGNISTLFLNVNSGLLTFGTRTDTLTDGMTGAQLAALSLNGQIDALHWGADKTRIDFVGLSAALASVDTETFTSTISLVFENLAARISGVIDNIGAERIALREAALQIVNPTVMGKDAIWRSIAGISVNAPGNAGMVAAQQALGAADAGVAAQKSAVDYARSLTPSTASLDASRNTLIAAEAITASASTALAAAKSSLFTSQLYDTVSSAWAPEWQMEETQYTPPASAETVRLVQVVQSVTSSLLSAQQNQQTAQAAYSAALGGYSGSLGDNATQVAAAQAKLSAATAAQSAAVTAARAAQLAYVSSIQDFTIDASKAVTKLGRLREETVKYYEAQKQLADLMGNSAAGLRSTVADYRYSQLSDAQQFDKLQADFAKNYAMGLSTDGSTLAGYGDKLNAGLNPLLEKAREVLSGSAYDSFAATTLARAEAIAGRLETLTPTDYAADSLMMLGQIDATLSALDASSKSAEKIISDAVNAGSALTASGLRGVIYALGGTPAFAGGGTHAGGLRLVGENGPELEVTGPSQIFNARQTRGLLQGRSGGNAEMVAELRALRQEVASLRIEARATAVNTGKTTRILDRSIGEGDGALGVKVLA